MNWKTKKLVTLAMLSTLAYVVMFYTRALPPIVLFLKYDPKDIVIAIGGFLYGPLSAFLVSCVVSLLEMVTVSTTGPYGLLMNILATCAFACPAALIYRKKHSLRGAVLGLVAGMLCATAAMLLWNFIITPIYMNRPRADIASMLIPIFLPFNLLKSGLNAAATMLLYKPVVTALRRSHLVPPPEQKSAGSRFNFGFTLVSVLALATTILLTLAFMGKL